MLSLVTEFEILQNVFVAVLHTVSGSAGTTYFCGSVFRDISTDNITERDKVGSVDRRRYEEILILELLHSDLSHVEREVFEVVDWGAVLRF